MASTINASSTGSGGLVSTGDASGQLELQANGTTKLTVSSSGVNLGGLAFPTTDGTSGQVIQTNGSGTLSFATPAGGSWTYLSTVTASSSATVNIETTIDSTYDVYVIVANSIVVDTNSVALRWRAKISGSYSSSGIYYYHLQQCLSSSPSYNGSQSQGETYGKLFHNIGSAFASSASFYLYLYKPSSTSLYKLVTSTGTAVNDVPNAAMGNSSQYVESTSAITGVQVYASSGNIASGTFRLYGIKNS